MAAQPCKRKLQRWTEDDMEEAVTAVLAGEMGYKRGSDHFNVPQSTLERRVKKARESGMSSYEVSRKGMGVSSVFSAKQENEFAAFILEMEKRMFGLTLLDVRRLAFELAQKNNLTHNFNTEKGMAGKGWLYGFLKRNPQVTLRSPEANKQVY